MSNIVGWLLIAIGLCLIGVAVLLLMRWQQLADEVKALAAQTGASDTSARQAIANAERSLLTVEVLNPLELARENSRIGAKLAGVAPGLVRRRVYQQVASELAQELESRGVQANVEVHKGGA